jgi:signal transduction histidine kinase
LNLVMDHSSLEVEDRGRGFHPDAALDNRGHLGLTGMRERAREIGWSISVSSRPGQGTRICTRENPPGANV